MIESNTYRSDCPIFLHPVGHPGRDEGTSFPRRGSLGLPLPRRPGAPSPGHPCPGLGAPPENSRGPTDGTEGPVHKAHTGSGKARAGDRRPPASDRRHHGDPRSTTTGSLRTYERLTEYPGLREPIRNGNLVPCLFCGTSSPGWPDSFVD